MSDSSDSQPQGGGRRRVDAAAKIAFIAGLRAGLPRDEAASAAGFTANAFYYAGKSDPVFRQAWRWANELSAADDHAAFAARPPAAPDETEVIAPNANRRLQRRRTRRRVFDDARKRIFLDNFAGTADAHQAADAAKIGYPTVVEHRRRDPEFAAAWDEALAVGYAVLEAEALRGRLEAQRALREGLCPTGEVAREFERVIQLLDRYQRKSGPPGLRTVGPGRQRSMSFDEAIAMLDRRLRNLGARSGVDAEPIAPPRGTIAPPRGTVTGNCPHHPGTVTCNCPQP